jgi:hypothetical protein
MKHCSSFRHPLAIFVLSWAFSISAQAADGEDNKPYQPKQVHGEVFGLANQIAANCGRLLVLKSAKEAVEDFGELRRNSAKVAEFHKLSSWSMQTVDKPKPVSRFSFSPQPGFGLQTNPRDFRSLIVTPVDSLPRDAGLGEREPVPERIRQEIGLVNTGPYAGRAQITVTRVDATSVVAEIKNMTRQELVQLLKDSDGSYMTQNNLRREQFENGDNNDSFFPNRTIYIRVSDSQSNNQIYETDRRDLFDESRVPAATSYTVRITAPGMEIWDQAGIWGGTPGKTYIHNRETNAVRLMEFLADFLQKRG